MSQTPRPYLVVNPRSGGGVTGRTFDSVKATLERALGPVDVGMTERPGHGVELAREAAASGRRLVIAVGGDGTIHEVVNGLLDARRDRSRASGSDHEHAEAETELGIIGQGTGGDFRKSLDLEHRLDRYVEAIASGRKRTVDVGRFEGGGKTDHHFANILSVGMGGLVDQYVASASRTLGGKAAYFGASLKALLNARLGRVHCRLTKADGAIEEHELSSFMIAICNGRFFGGGMMVAPMASLDDGVFEIVALGAKSKVGFALTSGSIYSGKHIGQGGTVHLRGKKVELELVNTDAKDKYLLDVDGEPMGSLPLTIECIPNALVVRA